MKLVKSAAVAAMIAAPGALSADGVALVIGAADYRHAPRAMSAAPDAAAVRDALADAGYDVVYSLDPTRRDMRVAMAEFATRVDAADSVVIYYTGHAMRMAGRSYLAPVGFDPTDPAAVAMDGAPLAALTELAARKPGAAAVFIDAAQLRGFTPSDFAEPGVADIEAPDGVLVVSAAAPGRALRRRREEQSDFSATVIDGFLAEGARANAAAAALRAPIWTTGATADDFAVAPGSVSNGDLERAIELAFWQSTEASGTRADYQAYLRKYPDGMFAAIARNRVGDARPAEPRQTAAERAAAIEAALGLSRAQRRGIQADLTELGFDTNGVDGIFGRGTRGAIRTWQANEGLTSTGFLNADQVARLSESANAKRAARARAEEERRRMSAEEARRREESAWARTLAIGAIVAFQTYLQDYPDGRYADDARRRIREERRREEEFAWNEASRRDTMPAYAAYLDRFPNGRHARDAQRRYNEIAERRDEREERKQRRREERAWNEARAENTPKAYRDFHETYPDSRHADEARRREAELREEARRSREERMNLTREEWRSIEQRLAALGFEVGKINGKPSRRLRQAIVDYRRTRGLPVHQYVSRRFINALVEETRRVPKGIQTLNQMLRLLDNP